MKKIESIMIAGGGTGGHIYPAIAIAREIRRRHPDSRVLFVGTRYGLEKEIVPAAGFDLEFVEVRGLKGKSVLETIANLARLPLAALRSWRLISEHRPDALIGVGGYASGPVLAVGALRGIPTLVQEQNAFPGLTNRLLSKVVKGLAVGFPKALEIFGREGLVTGNPVRNEFFEVSPSEENQGPVRILIFGGSQGSRVLNDAMCAALAEMNALEGTIELVHQTGKADHGRVAECYRISRFRDARVTPFIDDMSTEMGRADLIICRAGAMTISELAAVGRASILVPFALASDNHQEFNARSVEDAGGGFVLTEKELSPQELATRIVELAKDRERLIAMGESVRRLAHPNAAGEIVDAVEKMVEKD